MSTIPSNVSVRSTALPRPEAPQAPRPAELPAAGQAQERAFATRPAAVADAHRVERPMPNAVRSPAPRGSFVDLVV